MDIDPPICPKCGQPMQFIGNLPRLLMKPVTAIYKCIVCLMIEKIEQR